MKESHVATSRVDGTAHNKPERAPTEGAIGTCSVPGLPIGSTASGGSIQAQADRLSDQRFPPAQRSVLARSIGRVLGNHHMQRVMDASRTPLIQRGDDKDKDKPKYKGPNPDTPFDLLPNVIGGVEDLAITELKSLTGDAIEHAYGEYKSAIELVSKELGKQKEAEEEQKKKQLEFTLGIALSFVPVVEIGEAIAGPVLLNTLQAKVNNQMDSLVAKAVTQQAKQEAFVLSREAKSALTDEALKNLAEKFSAEKATEAVKKAGEAASGEGSKLILSGSHPYDMAVSFLEAMRETASLSVGKLQVRKSLLNDLSQVLGVYKAFTGATVNYFRPALTDRAHNFIRQISGMLDVTKSETVVWINAYGARRLANVQYAQKDTYFFGSWITPDMVPLALKLQPNPKEVSTDQIKSHIPDPLTEIPANHDRLVRINFWGRPRLAIVKGESSWNPLKDSNRTTMTFVRWVAPDEENAQLARESGQIGGIPNIDPATVEGLKKPDEA
jgi:hypothetical protein